MPFKYNPFTNNLDFFEASSGGGGDVVGPASSTAGDFAIFADNTGKLLADRPSPLTVTFGGTGQNAATTGDILYGSAANVLSRLAIGSTGQILTVVAGIPSWTTAAPGANTWVDVTGTTQAIAINTGYIADNAALVTLTLPATAAQFSIVEIVGHGAGGWKIAQNASQQIIFGNTATSSGVLGFLASTNANDTVKLIATVGGASTIWTVMSSVGNLTVA